MKKPIAMKCTQDQYNKIKFKLEEKGISIEGIFSFNSFPYLVNNRFGEEVRVTNILASDKKNYNREVFEEWNEKVFLEACGIETEPEFVISKAQLDLIDKICNKETREYFHKAFPEVFETVLEVGKWYKKNWKDGDVDLFHVYSFNEDGTVNDKGQYWRNGVCEYWKEKNRISKDDRYVLSEATESEVFEALKAEAVKRGFSGNVYVDLSEIGFDNNELLIESKMNFKNGYLDYGTKGTAIFRQSTGKWGKVIETITREQAEKELGKKIIW